MGNKKATLSEHVDAFRGEALLLLRYYIAWKRIMKFEDIQKISRTEWADKMIALKCIENDLIIRVSKLDDTDRRVHSFQRALHELPLSHASKTEIAKKISDFIALIKTIKQTRRNEILAHLKVGAEDDFKLNYDLLPAIKIIVEIIDLFAGYKAGYAWSDGRYEKYDLRVSVLGEDPT